MESMKTRNRLPRLVATALLLAVGLCAKPVLASLPDTEHAELHESYRLLLTKFYNRVEPQALMDGARKGLDDFYKQHGLRVRATPVQADPSDDDATIDRLDDMISHTASAARVSPVDATYAAIEGMAQAVGDKYTTFFTPPDFRKFNDALDPEKISGIGVIIEQDQVTKQVRAAYVVPDTPAEHAGIQSGDQFIAIDGHPTAGMAVADVSKMLRGKPGSMVAVDVRRDGAAAPISFSIVRSELQPPTVISKMLPAQKGLNEPIGYIVVAAFGRETPAQFDEAYTRLLSGGAHAFVIDLRYDGGGYVDSALDIAQHFISAQDLLTVEQRDMPAETVTAPNAPVLNRPVVVLVNQYTASASEIMAGALQDDGAAELVGTKTFGKGVMQTLTPFPDGSAIKITTAHYLTPRHRDINLKGIDPDVAIDENRDARLGELDHDAQLRAAVAVIEKKFAAVVH